MPITYVGGTSGAGTGASYQISLNGTLTGGSNSSPSPGDIVVVYVGESNGGTVVSTLSGNNSGAYSTVTTHQVRADTWDSNLDTFYKIQGSSVDTTLTVTRGQNNTTFGNAATVQVWRGVDATTPLDVTPTTANAANSCVINPPAIAPTTAGAIIIAGGCGTMAATSNNFTDFSGMANFITRKGDGSTSDAGVAMASFEWSSGSYDPPAVSGGTTSTSSAWTAVTLALRPAPPPETDLTGNSSRTDHTSSNGGITQTHSATGNSVAQATTSTTGEVTSSHTLAGNSVAQTTTSTTGAVVSQTTHDLAGTSVAQPTTSSAGAVASLHSLAGFSAVQVTTSTAGAVTSLHSLAGASAAQSTTSTAGAVTSLHSLAGASAAQAATSTDGAVDLTLRHWLTGASAVQAATSTAAAIETESPPVPDILPAGAYPIPPRRPRPRETDEALLLLGLI